MKQTAARRIADLEFLNRTNEAGCGACGRKFTLGETVVLASGPWEGTRWVHEAEARPEGAGGFRARD